MEHKIVLAASKSFEKALIVDDWYLTNLSFLCYAVVSIDLFVPSCMIRAPFEWSSVAVVG